MSSIAHLLLLGVAFHALCIVSIFDIYFQSPVESSIHSTSYTSSPPAKRVLIFTLDGCCVDKLFKVVAHYTDRYDLNPDSTAVDTQYSSATRVPFLGHVMRNRGSWGVSHNHAPTESRPCHVALTAGMYEDPHAVTKNWKQHPVPFDSVFNQSKNAFIFGNKDVAPILARHAPQAIEEHYTASEEVEMVREDTTLLDVWTHRKMKELFARGTEANDPELYKKLHDDKLVIYCHFLGTDLTGPKYGADSKEYLENIAVVDDLIEKTQKMVEEYYGNDGRTAYVVNADHGMDLRGDHGDDAPAKTRTAIIAWGAGVQGPEKAEKTNKDVFDIKLPTRSRVEIQARLEDQVHEEEIATHEWGAILGFTRKDVMQTDVAALISALAGLPYPRNSVGVLPFTYLTKDKYRATALRANAQQLYQHALRKEEVKRARRGLFFIPYSPLNHRIPDIMAHINEATNSISDGRHKIHDDAHRVVEILSQEMIDICQNAIVYYQTYDWLFLLGSIVLGYVGWALVMIVAYLHPQKFRSHWLLTRTLDAKFIATVTAMAWWRLLSDSPSTYYLYGLCSLILWKFVWSHLSLLKAVFPLGQGSAWQWSLHVGSIFVCLELVVVGYECRTMFSLLFLLLALQPGIISGELRKIGSAQLKDCLHWRKFMPPSFWWSASCLVIAIFPCLPSENDGITLLIHLGALLVLVFIFVVIRNISTVHDLTSQWMTAFSCGAAPVLLGMATLQWTLAYLEAKNAPPLFLVVVNWLVVIVPPTLMLIQTKSDNKLHSLKLEDECDLESQQAGKVAPMLILRLLMVMLAFLPAFVLLSTSYEVLFYLALSSGLVSWVMLEAHQASVAGVTVSREVQRALTLLLFVQVSFFGTANVASMTSFQIPSTQRFLTEPAPSIAQTLVVLKLVIPFVIVACAFRLVLLLPSRALSSRQKELREKSVLRYFLLALALADVLAVQFLFLVNNEGSWKQMGNSIAEFCIVNAQIVLLPTIVFLARIFVHDLESN